MHDRLGLAQQGSDEHLKAGDVRGGQAAQPPLARAGVQAAQGGRRGGPQGIGGELHALGDAGRAAGGDDHGHLGGDSRAAGVPYAVDVGGTQRVEGRPQHGDGQVRGEGQDGGAAAVERRADGPEQLGPGRRHDGMQLSVHGRPLPVHRNGHHSRKVSADNAGERPRRSGEGEAIVSTEPVEPGTDERAASEATPEPASATGGTVDWKAAGQYEDIIYETGEGIAKITINRPERHNAFRPTTLFELKDAFNLAQEDPEVGVIIFTGAGDRAFCSGGDQKIRGDDGYVDKSTPHVGRLNVLDLQVQIRRCPKPVIAMIAGYAIGGGHVLHVCCDLSIAADNAVFGQTGPKVGSFDGGYGSWLLAETVGLKRAREIWYLCRQYDAQTALNWGLVNAVVPLARLEEETVSWAREMLDKSPLALRMLKGALNAVTDGAAGMQQFAGDATLLYYMSEEAQEGRNAFKEKRAPDFGQFPRRP